MAARAFAGRGHLGFRGLDRSQDFAAVCDRIQERTYGYKRLVGVAALVTAFLIVIF